METNSSNEDVLVLQTESGEQIALPVSALPSDFVPGDSGQIIMVESALDEQQQEIVVESSDTNEPQMNDTENLVSLHIETATITTTTATTTNSQQISQNTITIHDPTSNDVYNHNDTSIIQLQPATTGDKPIPRTYSKNNVVKSYAPTCGTTRIYQQSQSLALSQTPEPLNSNGAGEVVPVTTSSSIQEVRTVPHKKQKRKETLITRPINEEDVVLEFQVIEEPQIQEVEIKRKPRKEYRTKKRLAEKEKSIEFKEEHHQQQEQHQQQQHYKQQQKQEQEQQQQPQEQEQPKPKPKQEQQPQEQLQSPATPQTERRTRLSNKCRVATGKMYKCNDCDFSTDRINNIILHMKESCPNLKKI